MTSQASHEPKDRDPGRPPPADTACYKNYRFSGEIISHGVWLYYRFTLSYRDVQELLFERGITVSHEAVRQWCWKFGQEYANRLRATALRLPLVAGSKSCMVTVLLIHRDGRVDAACG